MGVKLLIRPVPPKGVVGPVPYELLKRLIDELCTSPLSGRSEAWSVTCQLLKQGHGLVGTVGGPAAGAGGSGLRDMWAVSFRDSPEQLFLLQRSEHKILECDTAMLRLLEKKLEYSKQMTVRFEGATYSKGDFVLRLCTATQAIHSTQALLGHCLEVEYLPVSAMTVCEAMMADFLDLMRQLMMVAVVAGGVGAEGGDSARQQQLAGAGGGGVSLQLEVVKPSYEKYGIASMPYNRLHAAVAYSDLVVAMLNSSSASASAVSAATAAAAGTGTGIALTTQQQHQQQQLVK